MYERSYGVNYDRSKGYQTGAQIAAQIRADIKQAVSTGYLPKATYSVRVHNYSGGRSINVTAQDLPFQTHERQTISRFGYDQTEVDVLTDEAAEVDRLLKEIHRSYNYDGSEVMVDYFDVNYYGSAGVEEPWQRRSRLTEKARKAAKKKAAEAIDEAGLAAVQREYQAELARIEAGA